MEFRFQSDNLNAYKSNMGCVPTRQFMKRKTILVQKSTGRPSPKRIYDVSSLDDYISIGLLGTGKYSEVIKSLYRPRNEYRALKIISKEHCSRFCVNELILNQSLNHPNILKSYEMLEDRNNFYISSFYCEGGNLAKRAKTQRFSEAQIGEIIFQVLSGIAHCHQNKIIHRDLKLENILLEKNESLSLKIADFGLACLIGDKDAEGVCGTPVYMAPEIFSNSYNEKIDMWSTGVALFFLAKNQFPLKCKKHEKRARPDFSTLNLNVPTAEILNEELEDLIQGLLEINPEKRLSAKEALNSSWLKSSTSH